MSEKLNFVTCGNHAETCDIILTSMNTILNFLYFDKTTTGAHDKFRSINTHKLY